MRATFFRTSAEFREWLTTHHATKNELLVGYHKKGSGRPSMTWPESVDQALCFGWIDGIRRSLDDTSYAIRFTPRRPGSIWSRVNIQRAHVLIEQGQMQPAGLRAFEARRENTSGLYSYEQRKVDLEEPYRRRLKKNKAAWSFFQAQPPSYRKAICWWIVSAKKEETRLKRLDKLVTVSARGRRLPS
jgi:uncharacterized protein YdeI (YjbR/CyaY-like superfamily)